MIWITLQAESEGPNPDFQDMVDKYNARKGGNNHNYEISISDPSGQGNSLHLTIPRNGGTRTKEGKVFHFNLRDLTNMAQNL